MPEYVCLSCDNSVSFEDEINESEEPCPSCGQPYLRRIDINSDGTVPVPSSAQTPRSPPSEGSQDEDQDESQADTSATEEGEEGVRGIAISVVPYGCFELAFGDNDNDPIYAGEVREDVTENYVEELKKDLMKLGYYGYWRFAGRGLGELRHNWNVFDWHTAGAVLALKYDLVNYYDVSCRDPLERERPNPGESGTLRAEGPILYNRHISNPCEVIGGWYKELCHGSRPKRFRFPEFIRGLENNWRGPQISLNNWEREHNRWRESLENGRRVPRVPPHPRVQTQAMRRRLGIMSDRLDRELGNLPEDLRNLAEDEREVQLNEGVEEYELTYPRPSLNRFSLGDIYNETGDNANQLGQLLERFRGIKEEGDGEDNRDKINFWNQEIIRVQGEVEDIRNSLTDPTQQEQRLLRNWEQFCESWNAFYDAVERVDDKLERFIAGICSYLNRAPDLIDRYLEDLRRLSKLDYSTALYIKHILVNRRLGDRNVFVVPMDDEITDIEDIYEDVGTSRESREEYSKRLIREVAGRTSPNTPPDILIGMLMRESGCIHTQQFREIRGRRKIVMFGVDYNIALGTRHIFSEFFTRPRWVYARGWGATQYTTFDDPIDGIEYHGGLPFPNNAGQTPDYIQSIRGSIEKGADLYVRKFRRTQRRDCTYRTRFNCTECLRHFQIDNFEPTERRDNYRLTDERFIEFFRRRNEFFPTQDTDQSGQTEEINPEERLEYPCSWLTAAIRYGGRGRQAWRACRRMIQRLQRGDI